MAGVSQKELDEFERELREEPTAMNKQVGGDHYKKQKLQPWDIIDEYELDFYLGNALKYLLRDRPDRVEDLNKCIHYIEKALENHEHKTNTQ